MTATLRPTSSGNLDRGVNVPAAMEARSKGDTYNYLRLLGAPEAIARRAHAHMEVRKGAAAGVDLDVLNRAGEQRFQILMGGATESRSAMPSEAYLRRRVAEIGREIRDAADDSDEDDPTIECPHCGRSFVPGAEE